METDTQTPEEIEAMLTGEPIKPAAVKPMKVSKMTPGEIVVAIMDETGSEMTPEERKQIESISDDEAMAAFLDANLGGQPYIGELKARSVFGTFMAKRFNYKAIGFATRYMTIRSCQNCMDFAIKITEKAQFDEDKINAGKLWLAACREQSVMLKRFEDMGQEVAPDVGPPKAKNKAPDIFIEGSNVVITQPSST